MVSEQWNAQNVEGTGRALILSTTSAFAKISNRGITECLAGVQPILSKS